MRFNQNWSQSFPSWIGILMPPHPLTILRYKNIIRMKRKLSSKKKPAMEKVQRRLDGARSRHNLPKIKMKHM